MIEPVEPRKLLSVLPLNPINLRPITDPNFDNIPFPRATLTSTKNLEVFGGFFEDKIVLTAQRIGDVNRLHIRVNEKERTIKLRDVIRISVLGNLGNDDIRIEGDTSLFSTKRVVIFGDDRQPFQQFPDGNDSITGTNGRESIFGGNGNDSIVAFGGNDVIDGNGGADTIEGGDGNDSIQGGQNAGNVLEGGNGNDTISGGSGGDTIRAGPGHDSVQGNFGDDSIGAGTGNDTVFGGAGMDTIFGEGGDDSLAGDLGDVFSRTVPLEPDTSHDSIIGGDGNDSIYGESGDDELSGGDGSDTLLGHYGRDKLSGGPGPDYLNGHEDGDDVNGGSGRDKFNLFDFTSFDRVDFNSSDNPNTKAALGTDQRFVNIVDAEFAPIDVVN